MSEFPSREFVARVLGARVEEVRRVQHADSVDLAVVKLHDDTRCVVRANGSFTFDDAVVGDAWVQVVRGKDAASERPLLLGAPDQPTYVPPAPQSPTGDEVPDGTVETVLAWVGDDGDRARRALVAEGGREKPRTGLTAKLTELANTAPPAGDGA